MAILKRVENNELYLYMDGKLVYKRWLDTGQSKVFDVMAYDKYTLTSIRDLEYENPNGILSVKAKIKTTEEGGRKTGFASGYRPNHVFEYPSEGQLLQAYVGEIVFDGKRTVEPGEEREVTVQFLLNQPIEKYLKKGFVWWIHEGAKQIGQAEML